MSISKSHKIKSKREVIVVLKSEIGQLNTEGPAPSSAAPDVARLIALLSESHARMRPVSPWAQFPLIETAGLAISREARQKVERYHSVSAPDERIDGLITSLQTNPAVESVYVKPPAEPPMVRPREAAPASSEMPARAATPDFTGRQDYLGAAPVGIDAKYAWNLPGGRGTGVRIIDCEWAWNFDHEDLADHCSGNVVGIAQTSDDDHGTSVAGVLIANDNNIGAIGVAPDSILATAAFDDSSAQSTSAIIMQAADHLSTGDILLLEIHRPGPNAANPPNGQEGFIAIEWWPDDFAAIAYATAKGILVVEAGGNGSENLDDPLYDTPPQGFPADWKNPFAASGPDSGAILVGAGNPPAGTHSRNQDTYGFNEMYFDRARCAFSNYGTRIDCQGWGWEVTTLGGGDLQPGTANIQSADHNFLYTDVFAGTSSASPIIAGTLACLQGMIRATGIPLLTPKAARRLLRSTGSAQQPAPNRPITQRIGTRPDLKALCAAATNIASSPMITNPGTIQEARQQLNIVVDLIPIGNSNRPGAPLKPLQITIHNTDNSNAGADAHAHAIYQQGPDARSRQVSWHFTVDDHSVYQSLPVNEVGWHTGTYHGNYSTIGIEICENAGIDQQAANDRAALLTAVQLHELGISLEGNIVQHFDWSRKNCPALLRNPPSNWENFLARVAHYYDQVQLDAPDVGHSARVNPSPTYAESPGTSDALRYSSLPPVPTFPAISPSVPSGYWGSIQTRIYATEFGGGSDYPQRSAYGGIVDPDQPQAALPAKLPSSSRHILVTNSANGRSVHCLVNDRGPWNLNDAYWADDRRPAAEYQMKNGIPAENGNVPNNPAGIDLTPAAMQALGLMGPINSRSALVDWRFAQEGAIFSLLAPDASFGPFVEKIDSKATPATSFPPSAPFSGVADLYEENAWNAQKLWDAGVRMVLHKIGQWKDEAFAASKAVYAMRKAEWVAFGGVWAAYYLPYAQGTADGHLAHINACEPDPNIYRAIDWEPQWKGGPIASKATISALAGLVFRKYGRHPLKYGSRSTLDYGTDPELDQCENWFANPNGGHVPASFNPVRPPPGRTPLWQWTEDGDAIVKEFGGTDFSAFDGTADELLAKFGMKPPPLTTTPLKTAPSIYGQSAIVVGEESSIVSDSLSSVPSGQIPRHVDTLYEVYYSEQLNHQERRDVMLYTMDDRSGFFHRGSMQIDVDGSPRAYFPKNASPIRLDNLADAGSDSKTYIQGKTYGRITAKGPRPGFYVSATSLRYDPRIMWDCGNFVDAEIIPYFIYPPHRNGIEPGDVGIIVHVKTMNWTPAIFADSNDEQRVSEASLRVAVNLGLSKIDPATLQVTGLTAGNGDDARDFFYLYFPGSAFSPQQSAPHWPESAIRQAAAAKFAVWGGLDMVRQCLNQI